jgi:hypothetical protein
MTDCIRVQDGKAVELFIGSKADQADKFTPEIVDALIEVESGSVAIGDVWNGTSFSRSPPPEDPPLTSVSPRQIRLALNALNLRETVDAYVAAAGQDTKDSWEYATQIDRDNPLIAACAAALGKSEEEIDALFELAASL